MAERMTVADLDIAAFLRARLDERERHANSWPDNVDYDENQFVLADVVAKRQIIERCTTNVEYEGEPVADDVLRLLALPYAGHPDYREDWKP